MLRILFIFFLLLPTQILAQEIGIRIIAGPTLDKVDIHSPEEQTFFFNNSDLQTGFSKGVGILYNHHLSNLFYLSFDADYRNFTNTFRQIESEIINIDGEDAAGEFEHLFQFDSKSVSAALSLAYKIDNTFATKLGISFVKPIQDFQSNSRETIVTPKDAGVFKIEKTRVRNIQETDFSPNDLIFNLKAGIHARFPMNKSNTIALIPSFSYSYPLNNNTKILQDWSTHFFDLSVGVSFALDDGDAYNLLLQSTEPRINILVFELQDMVERQFNTLNLYYDNAINLQNGAKTNFIRKDNRSLITYISIDNLDNRLATLNVLIDDEVRFKTNIENTNSKIFIPLDDVIKSTEEENLRIEIVTSDNYNKYRELDIKYQTKQTISYLMTNDLSILTNYMDLNKNKNLELYTDYDQIAEFARKQNLSNLTILSLENYPYVLESNEKSKFILIIR